MCVVLRVLKMKNKIANHYMSMEKLNCTDQECQCCMYAEDYKNG